MALPPALESKQHQDIKQISPVSPQRPSQGRQLQIQHGGQASLATEGPTWCVLTCCWGLRPGLGPVQMTPPLGVVCVWPEQACSFLGNSPGQIFAGGQGAGGGVLPRENSALSLPRLLGYGLETPLPKVAQAKLTHCSTGLGCDVKARTHTPPPADHRGRSPYTQVL